jgi:NurA-like 5'-3' nuclease
MDDPVFIFSAGPRSGSTLLQRLVISSREVLMWGETGGAINNIVESLRLLDMNLRPASQGGASGEESFNSFLQSQGSTRKWIANMQPPIKHAAKCYSDMLIQMYGEPAMSLGYQRWGIKEVRCNVVTYRILKHIFPKAKFLFLVRHPLHALRSIKQKNYNFVDNYGRRLQKNQLLYFANNWTKLASEFFELKDSFLIKYEDLASKNFSTTELCSYLNLKNMDTDLISDGKTDWIAGDESVKLTDEELSMILPTLKPVMEVYGYQ